jgi:hypothetical protein
MSVLFCLRYAKYQRRHPSGLPHPRHKFPSLLNLSECLAERVGGISAEPTPSLFPAPHAIQYHRQMTARQTRTFRTQSQESITQQMKNRCFTPSQPIGIECVASRWDFNIQQDSRELKRKTVWVQPPASAFHFQETGWGFVQMYSGRGVGCNGAQEAAVR